MRSRCRTRCRLDFTLPTGMPVTSAISWWLHPSTPARYATTRCVSGSARVAAVRSASSCAAWRHEPGTPRRSAPGQRRPSSPTLGSSFSEQSVTMHARSDPAQGRTSRECGQPHPEEDSWPCRARTTTLAPHPGRFDSKYVKRWWPHRTAVACKELIADLERAVPLDVAARACCCPARPVVTVVMPPTASRPHPVDLLLCGHHFRASQAALRAAGAAVYDEWKAPPFPDCGNGILSSRYLRFQELIADLLRRPVPVR